MAFKYPEFLAETDWLADHLNDSDIRVLDCTAFNRPDGSGGIRAECGRESWAMEHIPGSGHADLVNDLSDNDANFRYMLPQVQQLAKAFSGYGVGAGTRAVLYDSTTGSWATRIWWMLRAFGFDDAYILNGGLHKWKLEGRHSWRRPAVSADPLRLCFSVVGGYRRRCRSVAACGSADTTTRAGRRCGVRLVGRLPGGLRPRRNSDSGPSAAIGA